MQSPGRCPTKAIRLAAAFSGLLCSSLFAQSTPTATATIVSAGYSLPFTGVKASPGQVLSVIVSGFDYRLQSPVLATSMPLPTTLAGFSVSLQQGGPQNTFAAALLGVQQSPCLLTPTPGLCPAVTILSVQIPFEVLPDCLLCLRPTFLSYLIVSDGASKTSVSVTLPADNIHIIDACDTTARLGQSQGVPCGKTVTHADGSPVTASSPAKVGEQVVLYAFGLGQTQPRVKTGEATPNPPPQFPANTFGLIFNFAPNAAPSVPNPRGTVTPPVYAGLVVGFAGLYQINFIVPPAPSTAPYAACSGSVRSNLTVTLLGPFSSDGAGICVQPQ